MYNKWALLAFQNKLWSTAQTPTQNGARTETEFRPWTRWCQSPHYKTDCVHQNLITKNRTYIKLLIPIRYLCIVNTPYTCVIHLKNIIHSRGRVNSEHCYQLLTISIFLHRAEYRKWPAAMQWAHGRAELLCGPQNMFKHFPSLKKKGSESRQPTKKYTETSAIRCHVNSNWFINR
jgi:hypothetical protein